MSNVTTMPNASAKMTEIELVRVLQSSLYPGASLPSVQMVLGYCEAAGLDPMQKPVHIVPMWDGKAKQMRDVVMPGIGLYRTQAARTGEHMGTDEPVYGPLIDLTVGDFTMKVPEWCKVTVYRMKQGQKCAFTATEYWLENYATAGKDTQAPNAMWKKRARGQIAKCAEAQALRKGFPEVGNVPTADEMEGKTIDAEIDITPAKPEAEEAPAELVAAAASAAVAGETSYKKFWTGTSKENRQLLASHHDQFKAAAAKADADRTIEQAQADPDPDFVAGLDSVPA